MTKESRVTAKRPFRFAGLPGAEGSFFSRRGNTSMRWQRGSKNLNPKQESLFSPVSLMPGLRLPGGESLFIVVVRQLLHLRAVVPHYEKFAIRLRAVGIDHLILEAHA